MRLTVSDGGHVFTLHVREDIDIPAPTAPVIPPHKQFLDWWRAQCKERHIPYEYTVAEPMGIRIIQSMLKKRELSELKKLAAHFFRDHTERIIDDSRHFSIFAAMADKMESELVDRV